MTTQAAPAPAQNQNAAPVDRGAQLLQQWLDGSTDNEKVVSIRKSLEQRKETIGALVPEGFKSHNLDRWIKRAMLYLSSKPDMKKHIASAQGFAAFTECVFKAAELGLAIDGRLAYAVPFKGKLTFVISYIGMIAVAKRAKVIVDCEARLVYDKDAFSVRVKDDKTELIHEPCLTSDRGNVKGAYARVWIPGGQWRMEWMNVAELAAIRQRSPAGNSGPWVTDTGEMQKKTVLRRLLKLYYQDPLVNAAMGDDDFDSDALDQTLSSTEDKLAAARKSLKKGETKPASPAPDPAEIFAELAHRIDLLAETDVDGGKAIKEEMSRVKTVIGEDDWMLLNDRLADRLRVSDANEQEPTF
jgi:phage RecT family recombinase